MKIVDTTTLLGLANKGRLKGYRNVLHRHQEVEVDPNGRHIISHPVVLEDGSAVRCGAVVIKLKDKREPLVVTMDIDIHDYNSMPEYQTDERGHHSRPKHSERRM
jgi:arginase family enzyme